MNWAKKNKSVISTTDWSFFNDGNSLNKLTASSASLILEDSGSQRMFTGEVVENMTVMDVLNASAAAGNFDISYRISASGDTIIDRINNSNVDNVEFSFFLNGSQVNMSELGRTFIKDGDLIEVKIE